MPLAVIQSSSLNQDRSEGEAAGVVSTARVERGPSQAARSASTETMAAAPPSSPSLTSGTAHRLREHETSGLPLI